MSRRRRAAAALAGLGIFALVALKVWLEQVPSQQSLPAPQGAIVVSSAQGQALLAQALRADHEVLRKTLQSQARRSFCGVASSATVISAVKGRRLEQEQYFTGAVTAHRSRCKTLIGGMTLEDLAQGLRAHGLHATAVHAANTDVRAFQAEVARNLASEGDYLLVNYQRTVLNEVGGGHISPLAAFDPVSQRVLLLDTATYKYGARWVPLQDLFSAMQTIDSDSGRSRGWVRISPAPPPSE